MAFSTVKIVSSLFPTSHFTGPESAIRWNNLNSMYAETFSSNKGRAKLTRDFLTSGTPITLSYTGQCREGVIGTAQDFVEYLDSVLQANDGLGKSYTFMNIATRPITPKLFEQCRALSTLHKDYCVLQGTGTFRINNQIFSWEKLSVLQFLLRSLDFIPEADYYSVETLIPRILANPKKCFPNNGNEIWMATMLAWSFYCNAITGSLRHRSLPNTTTLGRTNGINSLAQEWVYRYPEHFAQFCIKYGISPSSVGNNINKLGNLSWSDLFLIFTGRYTVDAKATPVAATAWGDNEEYDSDDDDDDYDDDDDDN